MLNVTAHHQGLYQVITLAGELQHETVTSAEAEILSTIAIGPAPIRLILDLTSVSFPDSGGVNAIAKTRTAGHAADGSLCLVCPHGSRVRRVLHRRNSTHKAPAGHSTSSGTPRSSTSPSTGAPPPNSRPSPATSTWAVSAGTSNSANRPPPRSPPTPTPRHDVGPLTRSKTSYIAPGQRWVRSSVADCYGDPDRADQEPSQIRWTFASAH
jgi:anti-anti-sigma factor